MVVFCEHHIKYKNLCTAVCCNTILCNLASTCLCSLIFHQDMSESLFSYSELLIHRGPNSLPLCIWTFCSFYWNTLFAFPSTLHLAGTSSLKNHLRFMFPCDSVLLSIMFQVFQISAFSPYSPRYPMNALRTNMAPFEHISRPSMSIQKMLWLSFLQYLLLSW